MAVVRNRRQPREAHAYRAEASSLAFENLRDFLAPHLIEVVGNGNMAAEKTGAANGGFRWRVDGSDFHDGLAGFSDDEGFALRGLLDEAREVGFGFVDIHGAHDWIID